MADPSMYNFLSQSQPPAAEPTRHAAAPSNTSSLRRLPCLYCRQVFYTYQALGGHQNAHKHERGASRGNFPAANQQQFHPLPQLPAGYRNFQAANQQQYNPLPQLPASRRNFQAANQQQYNPLSHFPAACRNPPAADQQQYQPLPQFPAARGNLPAADKQQYHPLPQFPADQQQQYTAWILFPHFPGMDHPAGAAVSVEKWLEPFQPQAQHLPSSSVPQSFLAVSTPDAVPLTLMSMILPRLTSPFACEAL